MRHPGDETVASTPGMTIGRSDVSPKDLPDRFRENQAKDALGSDSIISDVRG